MNGGWGESEAYMVSVVSVGPRRARQRRPGKCCRFQECLERVASLGSGVFDECVVTLPRVPVDRSRNPVGR